MRSPRSPPSCRLVEDGAARVYRSRPPDRGFEPPAGGSPHNPSLDASSALVDRIWVRGAPGAGRVNRPMDIDVALVRRPPGQTIPRSSSSSMRSGPARRSRRCSTSAARPSTSKAPSRPPGGAAARRAASFGRAALASSGRIRLRQLADGTGAGRGPWRRRRPVHDQRHGDPQDAASLRARPGGLSAQCPRLRGAAVRLADGAGRRDPSRVRGPASPLRARGRGGGRGHRVADRRGGGRAAGSQRT